MPKPFTRYCTADYLLNEKQIAAYLTNAIVEDVGDGVTINIAMQNIARARHRSQLVRQPRTNHQGETKTR